MASLELAYRTVKMFGLLNGSLLIIAATASRVFPSSGQTLKKLRVRGLSQPFFIRPRTSDRVS